ncbi:hypothetical protein QYM36_019926 [Artemia franciscana]|uniref:Uncharacterized protein n=1 Tax=Artemia franciscana TaxID=6661 RepID=A0AA88H9P5_ARTSF|nr:hypothetical protein QYM36_019926 [Artemia franciscana]
MSRLQKYRSDMTKPIKVDVVSKPSLPSEPQPSGPLVSQRDPTAVNQNLGPCAAPVNQNHGPGVAEPFSPQASTQEYEGLFEKLPVSYRQSAQLLYHHLHELDGFEIERGFNNIKIHDKLYNATDLLTDLISNRKSRYAIDSNIISFLADSNIPLSLIRNKGILKDVQNLRRISPEQVTESDGSFASVNSTVLESPSQSPIKSRQRFKTGSGWKMALVSLHLTNSFDSLRQDQDYFFKLFRFVGDSKDPSKRLGTKITLPKNKRYNTIPEIIKDMNNLVYTGKDSVNFHYNKLYDRVYILGLKVGESCYLSDGLREVFRYKENIIEPEPDNNFHQTYGIEGPLVPGLYYQWNSIFVYTDIVQRSRIGNTSAPILRILPRKTTNEEVISYSFQPLIYLDISRQNIEIVHFSFRTEKNNIIPINRGLISLTVEFRKDE